MEKLEVPFFPHNSIFLLTTLYPLGENFYMMLGSNPSLRVFVLHRRPLSPLKLASYKYSDAVTVFLF